MEEEEWVMHESHVQWTPEKESHILCENCGLCTCFYRIRLQQPCAFGKARE